MQRFVGCFRKKKENTTRRVLFLSVFFYLCCPSLCLSPGLSLRPSLSLRRSLLSLSFFCTGVLSFFPFFLSPSFSQTTQVEFLPETRWLSSLLRHAAPKVLLSSGHVSPSSLSLFAALPRRVSPASAFCLVRKSFVLLALIISIVRVTRSSSRCDGAEARSPTAVCR